MPSIRSWSDEPLILINYSSRRIGFRNYYLYKEGRYSVVSNNVRSLLAIDTHPKRVNMIKKISLLLCFFISFRLISLGDVPQDKCAALFAAVKKDDLQQVLKLLGQGADVNCRGEYQYTPLITAARYNRLEIAEALCDKGADVKAAADVWREEEWGYTPLLWAAKNGNYDMTCLLLNKGALVGKQGDGEGEIPLIVAARWGHVDVARALLDKGAVVDEVVNEIYDTALMTAVIWGHLDLVDYLIERGADIKRKDQSGQSLLHIAVGSGHFAEVRYLHEKGLSVNEDTGRGLPPLFDVGIDRVENRYILEYLIEHGAKVNQKSDVGTTPLMMASSSGSAEAVRIMIANGAVVRDTDDEGKTPLHYACDGIRDYYLDEAKKWEKTIGLLLENGADVNAQNKNGRTPMMNAARHNAARIVELLIEHGASVDLHTKDGTTALMVAADNDEIDVIKVLVKHDADLNIRDQAGETALTAAKRRGKHASRAAELLKSLGAKD